MSAKAISYTETIQNAFVFKVLQNMQNKEYQLMYKLVQLLTKYVV